MTHDWCLLLLAVIIINNKEILPILCLLISFNTGITVLFLFVFIFGTYTYLYTIELSFNIYISPAQIFYKPRVCVKFHFYLVTFKHMQHVMLCTDFPKAGWLWLMHSKCVMWCVKWCQGTDTLFYFYCLLLSNTMIKAELKANVRVSLG